MDDSSNNNRLARRALKPANQLAPNLQELAASVLGYAEESQAEGTRREYAKHWREFEAWCGLSEVTALPAEALVVAFYITARADGGWGVSTLKVALAAIWNRHEEQGFATAAREDAVLKKVWKGIKRRKGIATKQKSPLSTEEIRRLVDVTPQGILGVRDRALLVLGFAGGFRRSELVGLDVQNLKKVREGLEVFVCKSKTDQEGEGLTKAVVYGSDPAVCPVRAIDDWLELSGIAEGPVFRPINRHGQIRPRRLTGDAVARVVKRTAAKAGMPTPDLSGHSLRAGFVTESAGRGADYVDIMKTTGQTRLDTVHRYNRRKKLWEKPASGKLGL